MLRAMSEQQPPARSATAQDDQVLQLSATAPEDGVAAHRALSTGTAPGHNPRRQMAVWGGILAGLGIGIALACLMHVIEESSPNGSYGSGIGGLTALVVIVAGPAIGLGFGVIVSGLIPDVPGAAGPPPREAASGDTAAS
jgi:hypothetical protein